MIFFWWIFVFAVVSRYARLVRTLIRDDDEHRSFSDSDSDSHFVPEADADLYEESNFSPRWLSLTEEEKRRRLSLELDEYLKESATPDSKSGGVK